MVRVMLFLRESYTSPHYVFLEDAKKETARKAFDAGVQCILKCQIRVDGKLTAWCAQHDETDFSPRPARTYELVSLSGEESVEIVRLLMSLDDPSPEVVESVQNAVAWFKAAALHGIRVEVVEDKNSPKGTDHCVVDDPNAPPLWARFYEIGTNQPIFCDRDGVAKRQLSEIGYERRNGYGWLGEWPKKLIEEEYPVWEKRWAAKINAAKINEANPAVGEPAAASPALPKIKIVLVGDSTVANGSGWGSAFIGLLNANAQGVNCAKGGRSSKSFIAEGAWEKSLAEKPDYVLIQFGHNDMPGKGPERETDPKTTYSQFMGQYVDEARAIGAKPILVTSLTRRTFGDDGKIHSTLAPYAEAVVRLAAEKNVPLIDLHAQSIALHNRLGPKESEKFDMPRKEEKKGDGPDKTHLSHDGAKIIGKLVADELQKVEPSLVPYFQ
jgi:lysophospholipase L1-like esterase